MGPTLEQYDRLANEYPEVAARIRLVRVAHLPTARRLSDATHWARATSDDRDLPFVLTLNATLYGRPGRMRRENRRLVELGWHPTGTIQLEATLTHEFGHLLMFRLEDSGYDPRAFVRQVLDTRPLSGYSIGRPEEAWAETLRAHHHGDEASRSHPLTLAVMQYIDAARRAIRRGRRES
jgi:hypothetical protein